MAFLTQLNVEAGNVVVPLSKAAILIGRDPKSNIRLEATEISQNHATITFSDGAYILKDNGSTNGSFVNGTKVEKRPLTHGDHIRFGQFEFTIDLMNPLPVHTAGTSTNLNRGGHSYKNLIEIKPLSGSVDSDHLEVITDGDISGHQPRCLPATGFIAHLEEESLKKLSPCGTWFTAKKGDILISEGKSEGKLIFIISGSLEARAANSPAPIGTIKAGEWIGEVSIFDHAGAMCSVIATDTVTYWVITRSNLEKFINEHRSSGAALLIGLASNLGSRLRASGSRSIQPPPPHRLTAIIISGISILAALGFMVAWLSQKNTANLDRAEYASLLEETNTSLENTKRLLAEAQAQAQAQNNQAAPDPIPTQIEEPTTSQITQTVEPIPAAPEDPIENQSPAVLPPTQSSSTPSASPTSTEDLEDLNIVYPSHIIVTTKTRIPLIVDGAVTGGLTIPEGRELAVLGVTGDSVHVELGESTAEIPKSHTNFQEALAAEVASSKSAPTEAKAQPLTPAVSPAKKLTHSPETQNTPKPITAPAPATFQDIQDIFDSVGLLHAIEQVKVLQRSSQKDINRYLRAQDDKWDRAAEKSKELLASPETPPAYRQWLTGIITAAEMFEPARLRLLEAELNSLDKQWIDLKIQETTKSP